MHLRGRLRRLRPPPLASVAAIAAAAATRAPGVPGRRHHLFGHMRSVSAFLWRHILRVERHVRGRWGRLLRCLVQARYRLHGLRPSQHVQAAAAASATTVPAAPATEAAVTAGRPL